ncbi:Small-conductance mechanosensitive channel [Loktanella sp. DSM 29012]|uniref:mechanosensitive ion channel family protein n=1 Tax=Loktanella sp. DSM 29012 TaxID=1881056 RepID=UPI0008B04858|nr:mechanosensitive ion channel domain-containing protein [Loktanella sp. DSM 29012]SEQ20056.1 Small-conductance mechanosensitive channel [Loktanella sp. DSM 29012]
MSQPLIALIVMVGLIMGGPVAAQVGLDGLIGGTSAEEEPAPDAAASEPEADTAALDAAEAEFAAAVPDLSDWTDLAAAVERQLDDPGISDAALAEARDALFDWRQRLLGQTGINSGRISTVQSQIEALTPVAADATPSPAIAARLDTLGQQLDRLRAPGLLAAEASARASGLISEIDGRLRQVGAERMWSRDNALFWPESIAEGVSAAQGSLAQAIRRYQLRIAGVGEDQFLANLPIGIVALLAALGLLIRSPRLLLRAQTKVEQSHARGRAVWAFLLSGLQIGLPVAGMSLLFLALRQFGVLPSGDTTVTSAVYAAGVLVIVARWLNVQLFPKGEFNGPLGYTADVRRKIRRTGMALGTAVAVLLIMAATLEDDNASALARAVVTFPVLVLASLLLWMLGALLRRAPTAETGEESSGRFRHALGLIYMGVAGVTPILALSGYTQAARGVFAPSVMTLAMLGGFIVLQQLITRIYAPDDSQDGGSLVPFLVGAVLVVLLLPVTALVWGASVTDLLEIWTQFLAGFRIGETVVSPTDFLTFAAVFAVGYLLTRFIQRSLKNSVLPRTNLDLGGQNAVVSGLGYVGITLAALIAITLAGIDLSSLAIVAGALSVGIGFGLQTIVQNFVSGIILLIERPIGEGDMIEVNGQVGFVRDISVRSTRIETFDRTDVIIPNADLVSGQVTNWTRGNLVGRLILPVGVAYGSDIEKVRDILRAVGNNHPLVIADPEPQALFVGFGASSLDFELRVILRDVNWKMIVTDEMNGEINAKLAAAGIEIPFPQQDIWLRQPKSSDTESGQSEPAPQSRPSEPEAMLTSDDFEADGDADPDAGQGA